jgi:hypothetical protein
VRSVGDGWSASLRFITCKKCRRLGQRGRFALVFWWREQTKFRWREQLGLGGCRVKIVPCTVTAANYWIGAYHRHHPRVAGGLFAAAVMVDGKCAGVAVAGRPCRLLQDGETIEITRVATNGARNACSKLYGSVRGAAALLGYRRVFTYTLPDEPGTSLRAAGFVDDGLTKGGTWSRPSRGRTDKSSIAPKRRWVWPAEARGTVGRKAG